MRLALCLSLAVAAPALACGVDVSMKVVGFDARNERVLVRTETKGDSEEIDLRVIELRSGKMVASHDIVTNDDEPADRASLRGKRWKEAAAKLKKDGFTVAPEYPSIGRDGVKLPNGVALSVAGVSDDETGFSGNELLATQGGKTASLLRIAGPVSDAPSIEAVYVSPDQRWVVAVERGCVNGKTYTFEVAALPRKVAAAKP